MTSTAASHLPPEASVLPALREDLEIVAEDRSGLTARYVVRDPRDDRVLLLEADVHFVASQLDGTTTPDEILARYHQRFDADLAPKQLRGVVEQLAMLGLLAGDKPRPTFPEMLRGDNLVPMRTVRLGSGDALSRMLAARLGWLFAGPGRVIAIAMVALAVSFLVRDPFRWLGAIAAEADVWFVLLALGIAVFVIDFLRQLAHAVALRRYGGQVHDLSLILAFHVVPFLVVDWSEALLLHDKSARLWTVFAGIWAEVLIFAAALIAWALGTPGSTTSWCCLAVSAGAAPTIVLRTLNPLTENAGSLLLATWLEVPRMRARGLAAFGDWLQGHPPRETGSTRDRRWLVAYGTLCTVWTALLVLAVTHAVGSRFALDGFSAASVLVAGVALFHRPLGWMFEELAVVRWFHRQDEGRRRRIVRWGLVLLLVLLGLIPYPYETGGPFVLLPLARTEIPTQIEGQVAEVLVREGQVVSAGQPLARIDTWRYETELKATREQLAGQRAQLRLLQAGPRLEELERAQAAFAKAEAEVERAVQQLRAAEAGVGYSATRAQRYGELYREDSIARQQWESAERSLEVDQQSVGIARVQVQVSQLARDEARAGLKVILSGSRPEQIESAQAEVQRLETVVGGLEEQLRFAEITATTGGRVITPYVDQKAGAYLRKGELFAVVEQASTIQAELNVPEEDAADLALGARVKVVTWAYPGRTFEGRVLFVAPVANVDKQSLQWRSVRVLSEISSEDGLLRPAMSGYAKIAASWRPLGVVLLWPPLRWVLVQVWYWLP